MTTHRCDILLGRHHDAIRLTILVIARTGHATVNAPVDAPPPEGAPVGGLDPWALAKVPAARGVLLATTDYGYLHAVTELVAAWNTNGLGWAQSVDEALAPLADPQGGYVDPYDPACAHAYGYEDGSVWWRTDRTWHRITMALLEDRQ